MIKITEGIINVNKPAEWTSQDVCAKLRGRLHIKRIGHTGTLDPMATGVLPVCIGKATRIIEYYDMDRKTYHASMKLGIETDTLDITGTVIKEYSNEIINSITQEDVIKAFDEYKGEITQIPPKYSALKINGQRAYDLARAGADFEMKGRKITIYDNEITSLNLEEGTIEFDVTCSKGTYIRTICDDIGRTLGCGGVMTDLVRTSTGYFDISESHDLSDILEMTDEEIENIIIPMDKTLQSIGKIEIDDNRVIAFFNGNSTGDRCFRVVEPSQQENYYKVYGSYNGEETFLGIGRLEKKALIPHKVIRPE